MKVLLATFLKSGLFPAQIMFQSGAYADADRDAIGSYGFIDELSGGTALKVIFALTYYQRKFSRVCSHTTATIMPFILLMAKELWSVLQRSETAHQPSTVNGILLRMRGLLMAIKVVSDLPLPMMAKYFKITVMANPSGMPCGDR